MHEPGDRSQSSPATEKDSSSISKEAGKRVENPILLTDEILNQLIKNNFSEPNINAKDEKGRTIFMHIVDEDSALPGDRLIKSSPTEVRKALDILLSKVDLNAQDNGRSTALMIAAKRMNNWAIGRLLANGANPFIENNGGYNVMTLLIKSNYYHHPVSELKNMIRIVFHDIEKYIQNYGMPSDQEWNNFIKSVGKAIQEKYQEDNTKDYQEELNNFIKSVGKEVA